MIISDVSQAPPRGSAEASASVTAGPRPFASIFLSELFAKKPIERPSGDQNGCWPPSVPANGCGTGSRMVCIQIICIPLAPRRKQTCLHQERSITRSPAQMCSATLQRLSRRWSNLKSKRGCIRLRSSPVRPNTAVGYTAHKAPTAAAATRFGFDASPGAGDVSDCRSQSLSSSSFRSCAVCQRSSGFF